jgi:hypothetical protein
MPKIDIAGVLLDINTEDSYSTLVPFTSLSKEEPNINISFIDSDYIPEPEGPVLLDEKIKWYRNSDNQQDISICIYNIGTKVINSIMHVDRLWEKANITYAGKNSHSSTMAGPLGELLVRNKIIFFQGMALHAAAIEWEGKGIIFSAPSGTGKSTQANLWVKYKEAIVINGDRSIIRAVEDQIYVYGSPWCGSSAQYLNKRAPLKAIVILEQAEENKLKLLDKPEALIRLLPRCFLPYYDDGGEVMNKALENVDKIISSIPIYLLKCRPEKEAVDLVYECVK